MNGILEKSYILCIHIGVIRTHSAIVKINNNQLEIVNRSTIERQGTSKEQIINIVNNQVSKFINESTIDQQQILGTGISTAGPVDIQRKQILFLPNLDMVSFDIEKEFGKTFPSPIYIDNDANAVALAEIKYGKGKETKNFISVLISTGIGAGIVINNDIYRGSTGTAGEIGHQIINYGGASCHCGNNGCWEAYASGRAIVERMQHQISIGQSQNSNLILISKKNELTYIDICNAADKQDSLSIAILKENGKYIGIGIANLINIFDPDKIILCGGLARAYKYFEEKLKKEIENIIPKKLSSIEVTDFGDDAELIGAAATFLYQYQNNKEGVD
jgi:glucokinase